jgi:hypothetical protein
MVYFNARSLNNKLPELYDLLAGKLYSSSSFDIIAVSETWLNTSCPNSLLTNGQKFNVIRKDRPTLGGGVCFFIRSSLHYRVTDLPANYTDLEIIAFDLHFDM